MMSWRTVWRKSGIWVLGLIFWSLSTNEARGTPNKQLSDKQEDRILIIVDRSEWVWSRDGKLTRDFPFAGFVSFDLEPQQVAERRHVNQSQLTNLLHVLLGKIQHPRHSQPALRTDDPLQTRERDREKKEVRIYYHYYYLAILRLRASANNWLLLCSCYGFFVCCYGV